MQLAQEHFKKAVYLFIKILSTSKIWYFIYVNCDIQKIYIQNSSSLHVVG